MSFCSFYHLLCFMCIICYDSVNIFNNKSNILLITKKSFFFFQILTAGQGLNDDLWHTLRFSRRFNSLKFQIDSDAAIRGTYIKCNNIPSS